MIMGSHTHLVEMEVEEDQCWIHLPVMDKEMQQPDPPYFEDDGDEESKYVVDDAIVSFGCRHPNRNFNATKILK
jgi:hypothetical protein